MIYFVVINSTPHILSVDLKSRNMEYPFNKSHWESQCPRFLNNYSIIQSAIVWEITIPLSNSQTCKNRIVYNLLNSLTLVQIAFICKNSQFYRRSTICVKGERLKQKSNSENSCGAIWEFTSWFFNQANAFLS